MKTTILIALIILMVSACAPAPQTDWNQVLKNPFEQREAELDRAVKLHGEQEKALMAESDKILQERLNLLSDRELEAYLAYSRAVSADDKAGAILAGRKLENLLSESGKLGAWQKVNRDQHQWEAKCAAFRNRGKELEAQQNRLEQSEKEYMAEMDRTQQQAAQWDQTWTQRQMLLEMQQQTLDRSLNKQ